MVVKAEIKYNIASGNGVCQGCTFSEGIQKEFQWEGKHLQRGDLTKMAMTCDVSSDQPTQIEGVATFQPAEGGATADQTTRQEVPPRTCHIKRQLFPNSQEPQVLFD